MRLILPVLLLLLGLALVYFVLSNPIERVDVALGKNLFYGDVKLSLVVLVALMVGAGFTGVIALIEGATIRMANRRLRREIQRLETENGALRARREAERGGTDILDAPVEPAPPEKPSAGPEPPPSAPVYEPDDALLGEYDD
jgi:hypothetical protein